MTTPTQQAEREPTLSQLAFELELAHDAVKAMKPQYEAAVARYNKAKEAMYLALDEY